MSDTMEALFEAQAAFRACADDRQRVLAERDALQARIDAATGDDAIELALSKVYLSHWRTWAEHRADMRAAIRAALGGE